MKQLTLLLALALTGCSFIVDVEAVRRTRDAGGSPLLNADRASLDFGSATVGAASAPASITLTNNGTAPMGPLSATLSGAGASAFTSPDLGGCAELAAGASCTVQVSFNPPSAQPWSATLAITASPGGTASLLLTGTGVVPGILTLSPALVDFGSVVQGGRSGAATFTVRNVGTDVTGTLAVAVTGVDALQFDVSVDNCTGQTLAPGASCDVAAGFAPGLAGPRRATLTVTGAPGGTAVAALTGLGVSGGALSISPSTRQLPSVPAGGQGTPVTFQLLNTGAAATGPIDLAFSGAGSMDFQIVDTDCRGAALQPSTTCAVRVRFAPQTSGQKVATLVAHAEPGGNATASLSAVAQVPAALEARPPSWDYGTVVTNAPVSKTFTLTNAGALATGIPTVAVSGADSASFQVVTHDCTTAIAAAGTCAIEVRFAPSAAGPHGASLVVSASPGGSVTVPLSGVGVDPGVVTLTPTSHDFGATLQGTTSTVAPFTVSNVGGASTGALSATLSGSNADQFNITQNDCSAPLAPAGSCTVVVAFAPSSSGTKSAELSIAEADGGVTVAQLLGTGLAPPQLTISPMSSDLGSQVEGQGGQTRDFTLRNVGNVALSAPLTASLSGPGTSAFSIVGNGCAAAPLGPLSTCTVTVQFTPPVGALGALSATLTVAPQSGPGGTVAATLSGTGLTPSAFSFNAMPFGSALIGATVDRTFTLTNNGGGTSGAITLSIAGGNAPDFQLLAPIGTDCVSGTTALAGGASCTVRVRWTVGGRGNRSSSLTATGTPGGTTVANLTGTGLQAATLTSTQTTASLGKAEVNVQSATSFTWTITNSGDQASGVPTLSLAGTNPGDFTATGCTAALAAAASCNVTVRFLPTALGPRSAQVRISATPGTTTPLTLAVSGDGQGRLTVTLAGTATNGVVASTPAGITCGSTCTGLFDFNQVITLRAVTTNGSNTYFRAWGSACTGSLRSCNVTINQVAQTVTADFQTMNNNLVFVSSVPYPNNLGSAAAYDTRCNQLASDAGINNATNDAYVAWVSTPTSSAVTRLGTARGFIRPDGLPVADQVSTLTTNSAIFHAIQIDQTATPRDVTVRTGTNWDGSASPLGDTCNGWTVATGGGYLFGNSSAGPVGWTSLNFLSCDNQAHIYCFMKTKTAALTPAPAGGKRMWLTDLPFLLNNGQTPDQRCAANRPAGVASGKALLGKTTSTLGSQLAAGATYVRPDGQVVGTTTELRAESIRTGPWQSANGTYLASNVWTGYGGPRLLDDPPPAGASCSNYTSNSAAAWGHVGEAWRSSTRWVAAIDNNGCNDTGIRLICIEP